MVLADDRYAITKSNLFLGEAISNAADLREHCPEGDGLSALRPDQRHGDLVRAGARHVDNSLAERKRV